MILRTSVNVLRKAYFLVVVIGAACAITVVAQLMRMTNTYSTQVSSYNPSDRLFPRFHKCTHKENNLTLSLEFNCTQRHSFLATNMSIKQLKKKGDNILVFLRPVRDQPHTGVRLVSVIDPVTKRSCSFTTELAMNKKSSVVIIPGRGMVTNRPYRYPNQSWIFYTAESFLYVKPHLRYRFAFNHTMTYHQHADIDSSQFGFMPRKHGKLESSYKIAPKTKGKLVVWMASHCNTNSKREHFVRRLSKYISVDTFGGCGNLTCPKREWCTPTLSKYKFYVAFENSVCNGYITEKPWIGFAQDAVPLVAGGGSEAYRSHLPPYSYIDVEQFKNVESVAAYLEVLDNNDTLYREYFAWRSLYTIICYPISDLSGRTCQYIHETKDNGPHMVDLQAFATDKRSVCQDRRNLYWT